MMPDDALIVLPSRPMFLTVAFDEVPVTPPDDLVAFVTPVDDPESGLGWQLTADAISFGDFAIVHRMNEWSSTWLRAWPLGQRSMLRVLRELITNEVDGLSDKSAQLLDALCGDWTDEIDVTVSAEDLAHLNAIMQRARTMIHRADRTGFGVIDTTPRARTVGLLRAWSVALGDPILAADESSIVTLTQAGLQLGVRSTGATVSEILEVAFQAEEVALVTPGGVRDLPSNVALPLAWTVPEATSWRVRQVPETLVWAQTFAGVADASDFSAQHGEHVKLRHDWSSATIDFMAKSRIRRDAADT